MHYCIMSIQKIILIAPICSTPTPKKMERIILNEFFQEKPRQINSHHQKSRKPSAIHSRVNFSELQGPIQTVAW